MALPRTETLSDLLPELMTTLNEVSMSKDNHRQVLIEQKAAKA